jgi:hypothetical protein
MRKKGFNPPMSFTVFASTPGERLKRARKMQGYQTAADFASEHGFKKTTYQHHENGLRELRADVATLYDRLLNLPAGTLLYGGQLPTMPPVFIVGSVRDNGRIDPVAGSVGKRAVVKLPEPTNLVGLTIESDDLLNYRRGDRVFYRATERYSLESLHGLECVIELEDGTKLIRQLVFHSEDSVILVAPNKMPMTGQRVVNASPIEMVQRYLPPHLSNQQA